jgi:hypothetical protein
MGERNEQDERDQHGDAPASNDTPTRQQPNKGAQNPKSEESDRGDQDGGTASRPRGHTEDPDRTL